MKNILCAAALVLAVSSCCSSAKNQGNAPAESNSGSNSASKKTDGKGDPSRAKELWKEATTLSEKDDRVKAAELLAEAIELDPSNLDVVSFYAKTLERLRRYEDSTTQYEAAVKLASGDRKAGLMRTGAYVAYKAGNELFKNKKYIECNKYLDRSLALAPNYDDAHELQGLTYFELAEWQNSLDSFSSVSEVVSDEAKFRIRTWMAQCMFRVHNFKGTIDVLDELADHRELDHTEHNLRAYALIELDRNDEAIIELERAVELAPEGKAKEKYMAALKLIKE